MAKDKQEVKLGRAVLEAITEIQETPKDNVKRFLVVERKLKRAVKAYKAYTGSDYLIGKTTAHYGFVTVQKGGMRAEIEQHEIDTRRNGNEPE